MAEKSVSDYATENILSIFDVAVLICQVTQKKTKNHKILLPHPTEQVWQLNYDL